MWPFRGPMSLGVPENLTDFINLEETERYKFGMAPSLDSSDHQDYYMFRIGDSELNLHFPVLQGGGHIQDITGKPFLIKMVIDHGKNIEKKTRAQTKHNSDLYNHFISDHH